MDPQALMRKVWNGMIPIELRLAAADAIELLASAVLPEPFQTFYLLVPRVSYLPFITARVKERWLDPMLALSGTRAAADSATIKESDIWFEYNGQPLKWHYPAGLLYDMLVGDAARGEAELPWSLTLHVRKFPADKLIQGPSTQHMRDMFMAMVKESDFIRNGSTKRVMDLAKSDQMQLLDGLETHSFEKYFAIHAIVVPTHDARATPSASSGTKPKSLLPKAIPVRFYMLSAADDGKDGAAPGGADGALAVAAAAAAAAASRQAVDMTRFHVSQLPVPLVRAPPASGEQTTVADAFRLCYEITDPASSGFVSSCVCLCQGIGVPWETPVAWLADSLFYADCFLHLVVVAAPPLS
ncbi:autophagy protein 5 [Coemansia nantahalensis]|uniref:Autophagy protein 5 n=1 Tax=Coemansia nantahalensis TaxID=2789366 RepID=A0ACC1JYU5_9FUNG|nr:autophagy protein 5 [Coemansia nantahalensis]